MFVYWATATKSHFQMLKKEHRETTKKEKKKKQDRTMLSDARSCGSYSDEYNYDYGKDQMPQGGRKEAEGNYGKGSDGQEENWARIELSTNKLYKYRKYDVRLFVKKSMRIRSGVSEIDILKSLLSAKCFCEGTRSGTP